MSSPILLPSSGSTVNRKWVPEVNTGTTASPVWVPLEFVNNFDPDWDAPSLQDSTVFADGGFSSQDKTGAAWTAAITVMRMVLDGSSPPVYGVAQEYLRGKAIGKFGAANRVQVRFYEFDTNDPTGVLTPRTEAYSGYAAVTWKQQGGAQDAESMVLITLNGKGKLTAITHPYPAAATVPSIDSIDPVTGAAAGGTLVEIFGHGFALVTGATGVKFGATNATAYDVIDDGKIEAIAPAHATGAVNVVVTNPTGPSTSTATYTYT